MSVFHYAILSYHQIREVKAAIPNTALKFCFRENVISMSNDLCHCEL